MEEHELLSARRRAAYEKLGTVSDRVCFRAVPLGGSAWPSSAIGMIRVVTGKKRRILVTDGLSDPYSGDIHLRPPEAPLDFELAISAPIAAPEGQTEESLAESWLARTLYSLTDWIVPEWLDLRGPLTRFRAVILATPAYGPEMDALRGPNGMVGVLVGLPIAGADIDRHFYLQGVYGGLGLRCEGASVGVFPVKPLKPDEYQWALDLGDEGGVALARRFIERGDGALSWSGRPSVLAPAGH